jgi:site-specific recombinase XerD
MEIKFYPNPQKVSQKTNKIPIYCRISSGRRKKEKRLPKTYDLEKFEMELWDERLERLKIKNSKVNGHLDSLITKFHTLTTFGDDLTLSDVIVKLFPSDKESKKESLLLKSYVKTFLVEEVESRDKESTKRNIRNCINQFLNYLAYSNQEDIKLTEFNFKQANDFKLYMEKELDPTERKGVFAKKVKNTEVSSSTKIKNVKPIFKKAISEGLIKENPFKNVKEMHNSPQGPYLSLMELKSLFELDLNSLPIGMQIAKDYLLFMCYTGLAISDTQALIPANFRNTQSGRVELDTTRNKTGIRVRQVLIKPAEMILNKYLGGNQHERIFPPISPEKLRDKLKILASYAGIYKNLTTRVARRSCRELIYESDVREPLVTEVYMGWQPSVSSAVQKRYLAITEEKLLKFSCHLEIFLHSLLIESTYKPSEVFLKANSLSW